MTHTELACKNRLYKSITGAIMNYAAKKMTSEMYPVLNKISVKLTAEENFEICNLLDNLILDLACEAYERGVIDTLNIKEGAETNYEYCK